LNHFVRDTEIGLPDLVERGLQFDETDAGSPFEDAERSENLYPAMRRRFASFEVID
jgi:hypothetical protein